MILRLLAFLVALLAASAASAQKPCQHWGTYPLVQGGCVDDPGSFNNLAELSIGLLPPQNAFYEGAHQGKPWLDTSVAPAVLRVCKAASPAVCSTSYIAAEWFTWAVFDFTGSAVNLPVGGGIVSVPSSGVVDLGRYSQATITITGNTTISSFGSSLPSGQAKILSFTGTPTLVYSSSAIVIPGATNIMAQPGDIALAVSLGGGKTQLLYPTSGGGTGPQQQSITTGGTHAITIASGDVLVNAAASVTLTLPTSGPISVADDGGHAAAFPITVMPPSGLICSVAKGCASTFHLVNAYGRATFVYDGTNYVVDVFVDASLGIHPEDYGAVGNGTTDDSAALSAAATAAIGGRLILRAKTYRASSTVVIPGYVDVEGIFSSNGGTLGGSVIKCDLSVSICMDVGNNDNSGGRVNGVTISRAAGSIPAGSVCIRFKGTLNQHFSNSECYRHAIGVQAVGNGVEGIYLYGDHITTCAISTNHWEANTFPGLYGNDNTMGCDGNFDLNAHSYVHITGNWDAVKGTVHFTNTHMNQGVNKVSCGISFDGFTGTTNQFLDFEMLGGHLETADNFVCSDSTVAAIDLFQIVGVWSVGTGAGGALNLNAATSLGFWTLSGNNWFFWTSFNAAPVAASGFSEVVINGNTFQQGIHFTGPAAGGSQIILTNNAHNGNVILDGTWATGVFTGTFVGGGFVSPSASAMANLDITLASPQVATCALQFGGLSVGITYLVSTPSCTYTLAHHILTYNYFLTLTSKGSSTGAATLTGLPYASSTLITSGGTPANAQNMASAGAGIFAFVNNGGTHTMAFTTWNASGLINATDLNFTNTSILIGNISYPVGGN